MTTTLTILTPVPTAGALIAEEACTELGDQVANDGRTLLYFRNGNGATTYNITLATGATVAGMAIDNIAFTLAPGVMKVIGPFEPRYWNDANGYIQITYDAVTDLVLRAIRVTG